MCILLNKARNFALQSQHTTHLNTYIRLRSNQDHLQLHFTLTPLTIVIPSDSAT